MNPRKKEPERRNYKNKHNGYNDNYDAKEDDYFPQDHDSKYSKRYSSKDEDYKEYSSYGKSSGNKYDEG